MTPDMTPGQRLYYTDSYQTSFEAEITQITKLDDQWAVALNQSLFYPTSGGQPNDLGSFLHTRLGSLPVNDVQVGEEGEVWHLLAPIEGIEQLGVGDPIGGSIDWPRRFDHMQQHSGQHLLSQAFVRLWGYETVSVHFGAEVNTLDLEVDKLDASQLAETERYASEIAYSALPITAYFVDQAELSRIQLRRPPKVSGRIRIVEIQAFDQSACGGTHCHTTAELVPIKLTQVERRRNQCRISFLCGQRAVSDYARKHRLLQELGLLLNTEVGQAPLQVERLLAQAKEQQQKIEEQRETLLGYEAKSLLESASSIGNTRLVTHYSETKSTAELKKLAGILCQEPKIVVLLVSSAEAKTSVVFAGNGQPAPLHLGNLLRQCVARYSGNGGGRADFAQGGCADATIARRLFLDASELLQSEVVKG